MPELPEVEYAAGIARQAFVGQVITAIRVLHRSQRRGLPPRTVRRVIGDRVTGIERRGKYQLFRLTSGRTLVVHFRMTGDWVVLSTDEPIPPAARVVLSGASGIRLALHDSRALSTVILAEPDATLLEELGPDAIDPAFSPSWLGEQLSKRRGPIKPALLDQGIVAGVGNIYASEALWYARIDPRTPASTLRPAQLRRLVSAIRRVMRKALERPYRYYEESGVSDALRFKVYDREGAPCRRCRKPIRRIMQAGRSTYFCAACVRGRAGER